MQHSGFAAIIGKPNVGKSTLMNRLVGQKLAITSYKPQTTRQRMQTIYTDERGQIIFVDTPGLRTLKTRLGEYMELAASGVLKDVDLILWLVEPRETVGPEDAAVLEKIKASGTPCILVINKIDKVKKESLLAVIAAYSAQMEFAAVIPVSARNGEGCEELLGVLYEQLPEGEPYYDPDMVTLSTEREIAGEIIREKALRLLQDEVPHGIAVTIERMRPRENDPELMDVDAEIVTERNAHKAIIIGKGGSMLKKIGTAARKDMEEMLGCRVNLKLFVKVRENWRDDDRYLRSFGYDRKGLKNG